MLDTVSQFSGNIFMIGAGAMAEAFIKGVLSRHAVEPSQVYVVNRSKGERLASLCARYGVQAADWHQAAAAQLVFVAVKPANVADALDAVRPYLHGQPLISFAAGVTMDFMSARLANVSPVIRTMPNIPVAVLEGATAISFPDTILPSDKTDILFLLQQLGEVVEIPERLMNAATAFSGSGPGFVCYFLEAMESAALKLGFAPDMARELLLQTVVGTANTLRQWGLSPHELRSRVTSPGGTTQAGVTVMEAGRLVQLVEAGLAAAATRSEEMGSAYSTASE